MSLQSLCASLQQPQNKVDALDLQEKHSAALCTCTQSHTCGVFHRHFVALQTATWGHTANYIKIQTGL